MIGAADPEAPTVVNDVDGVGFQMVGCMLFGRLQHGIGCTQHGDAANLDAGGAGCRPASFCPDRIALNDSYQVEAQAEPVGDVTFLHRFVQKAPKRPRTHKSHKNIQGAIVKWI